MNKLISQIGNYTPCRTTECFKVSNNTVIVSTDKGTFCLKNAGRLIWYLLDGKHSIAEIIVILCDRLNSDDVEGIQKKLIEYILFLQEKNAVINNWDPIYKFDLCQELIQND